MAVRANDGGSALVRMISSTRRFFGRETIMVPIQVSDASNYNEISENVLVQATLLVIGTSTYDYNSLVNGTASPREQIVALNESTLPLDSNTARERTPSPPPRSPAISNLELVPVNYTNYTSSEVVEGLTTSFLIDSTAVDQSHVWSAAGFSLYLPTGPLPAMFDRKKINTRTNIKGSYHFPPDTKVVSTIYHVTADFTGLEATLELEHCYRGDLQALAFVYCTSHQPPFHFSIVSQEEYKYSFTTSHGVIQTHHFSCWGIVALLNRILGYESLPAEAKDDEDDNDDGKDCGVNSVSLNQEIKVVIFYRIEQSHIKVNLVLLKGLTGHSEVSFS